MTRQIEYAGGARLSGLGGYESLATQTGRPLHEIVTMAEERRLNELFDSRGELVTTRTPTPARALRQLERLRTTSRDPHAERRGAAGRSPHELLRELERRRHAPMSPQDRLIATYARCRSTRDPREAMLALRALRISQNW